MALADLYQLTDKSANEEQLTMMNFRKSLTSAVIVAIFVSAGAAFAQDAVPQGQPPAADVQALCVVTDHEVGERPERGDVLLELGVTQDELAAARENGTLDELIAQYEVELEALREQHTADMEAERAAALETCLTTAVDNGDLTAEQAAAIRDAVANDTLHDLLSSEEFDGIRLFAPRERGAEGRPIDGERAPRSGEEGRGGRPAGQGGQGAARGGA